MSVLFYLPKAVRIQSDGRPYAGAKAYFYETGTLNDKDVFTDFALAVPFAQPVQADSEGQFPPIWLDQTQTYKLILKTASGVQIDSVDPFFLPLITTESLAPFITQDILGQTIWPRTDSETASGVVPTHYFYEPGNLKRYGAVSGGSVSANTAAWVGACAQAATNELDAAPVYIPRSPNGYEIDTGATVVAFPIKIYGDNAYNSYIRTTADISILTLQDIQQLNGPILENVGFMRDSSTGSSKAIVHVKNSSNGRIIGCQILRGYYGIQFEATATAPSSCYSWSITDSTIANSFAINIECESETNFLQMLNVTFGAGTAGGLHIVDSVGLSIVGGDCEGVTVYAIDLDATVELSMGALISGVDFESCTASVGVIRIGANTLVHGVTLISNVFNNAGGSAFAVNPVNCHQLTMIGNNNTTGFDGGYAVNPAGADQANIVSINNTWQTDGGAFQVIKGTSGFDDPNIAVDGWGGRQTFKRVPIAYSASMTPDAALGNHFEIVATDGNAFTINNPTNAVSGSDAEGQEITLWLCNTSGTTLGTITMDTAYKTAGSITKPATANNRSYTFKMRLGVFYETSRSAADVAN